MFKAILASLGIAPKSLDAAAASQAAAKQFAEAVGALFAGAGLDLDGLIAAGPDSLKAHIESVSGDDEALAESLLENERINGELVAANEKGNAEKARADAGLAVLSVIGAKAETKPEEYAGLFDSHIKKAAALELAKSGHPPVAVLPVDTTKKEMSQDEFNALSANDKMNFAKSGGKLTQ